MKSFGSTVLKILGLGLLAGLGFVAYYSLCFVGLAGCIQKYKWNEKMTLVVETPQGIKQASSVQSVAFIVNDTPLVKGANTWIKGEAVVLEVLPKQYLFVLLKGGDGSWKRKDLLINQYLAKRFQEKLGLKEDLKWQTKKQRVALTMKLKGKAIEMKTNEYPLLVTFKDINDPASVQRVNPVNLSAIFGPGVDLKRITLEITDEPVTKGKVENVLGWLDTHAGLLSGKKTYDLKNIEQNITIGAFRKGR